MAGGKCAHALWCDLNIVFATVACAFAFFGKPSFGVKAPKVGAAQKLNSKRPTETDKIPANHLKRSDEFGSRRPFGPLLAWRRWHGSHVGQGRASAFYDCCSRKKRYAFRGRRKHFRVYRPGETFGFSGVAFSVGR